MHKRAIPLSDSKVKAAIIISSIVVAYFLVFRFSIISEKDYMVMVETFFFLVFIYDIDISGLDEDIEYSTKKSYTEICILIIGSYLIPIVAKIIHLTMEGLKF